MYSLSESEGEEDESLSGSRVEISEASGEGLMSTLMVSLVEEKCRSQAKVPGLIPCGDGHHSFATISQFAMFHKDWIRKQLVTMKYDSKTDTLR